MAEYIERLKKNEYLKGWHDALRSAYNESHSISSEEGMFRVIQLETIIGLGLSKDSPAHEIEPTADVIEIPKDATNGEVFEVVFGDSDDIIDGGCMDWYKSKYIRNAVDKEED